VVIWFKHRYSLAQSLKHESILLHSHLENKARKNNQAGEQLNESITGERWPPISERNNRLRESVQIIRALFSGQQVTHCFIEDFGE
jgi:hypothetical protein